MRDLISKPGGSSLLGWSLLKRLQGEGKTWSGYISEDHSMTWYEQNVERETIRRVQCPLGKKTLILTPGFPLSKGICLCPYLKEMDEGKGSYREGCHEKKKKNLSWGTQPIQWTVTKKSICQLLAASMIHSLASLVKPNQTPQNKGANQKVHPPRAQAVRKGGGHMTRPVGTFSWGLTENE